MDTIKKQTLGWMDGKWAPSNEINIPICDRGLQMADGIFETILILNGKAKLLNAHLNRWYKSAKILNMEPTMIVKWKFDKEKEK